MSKRFLSRFLLVDLRHLALFLLLCPAAFAGYFQVPALADTGDDGERGYGLGDANDPKNQNLGGQSLSGANGDTFMEEVVTDKPKPKAAPVPIDLSRVGVSVDPHGNIVPLKDGPNDPWAASGVKPFYNHIETSTTVPYVYPNPYAGVPYGGYPGFGRPAFGYGGYRPYPGYGAPGFGYPVSGYPGYGFPGYGFPGYGYPGYGYPGYAGFNNSRGALAASLGGAIASSLFGGPSFGYGGYRPYPGYGYGGLGYPGYGNVYNPFNAYGPYNSGYSPFSVGYLTSGNSSTFISNDPTTGAPLPQQGNSQTVYSNTNGSFTPGLTTGFAPGLGAGAWLGPTTSFNQNSMWKAFNLGF